MQSLDRLVVTAIGNTERVKVMGIRNTPRHAFPIVESMSDESIIRIQRIREAQFAREANNAAAIRRVHSRH